jgi:hypothetical protein
MFKIVDDILTVENQKKLQDYMLSQPFPWFYNSSTSSGYEKEQLKLMINDSQTLDSVQFTHMFYDDNPKPYFNVIVPFLNYIRDNLGYSEFQFGRIKANLLLKNPNYPANRYNIPHVDGEDDNIKTLLYYVNDSDGDTVFFNEKYSKNTDNLSINTRVQPKSGTAVIFDSNYYHCSSPPIKNDLRCVINLVFKVNDSEIV